MHFIGQVESLPKSCPKHSFTHSTVFSTVLPERYSWQSYMTFRAIKRPCRGTNADGFAQTNLIWAIGSKWLHQAKLNDDPEIENHSVYYARARALGLDHRVLLDAQSLYGVKAVSVLSFY